MKPIKPLVVAYSEEDKPLPPYGTTIAQCVWVIDLGTQFDERFSKSSRKILIGWELPDCLMNDERPFMISKRYTFSLHDKALLRKDLESWRGKPFTDEELIKGFAVKKLILNKCFLNIVHVEKGNKHYANVAAIVALPKKERDHYSKLEAHNQPIYFDFSEYNDTVFKSLPEWIRNIIMKSEEWKAIHEPDDDVITDETDWLKDEPFDHEQM